MDFNELPDEVELPIIAAVGGSVVAAFNHFSAAFKRKSRRADIHVDKIEAEHQLDVGQAALIHRIVDQHLLQENSACARARTYYDTAAEVAERFINPVSLIPACN